MAITQETYSSYEKDFLEKVEAVRLEAYKQTGYEWMVVPKTGAYRSIKEQHNLFIQPTDGKDNDHDGLIDEADERVTKADGGQSPHNYNLARDIVPLKSKGVIWWTAPKELWKVMADIAVSYGLVSGFYFTSIYDAPHVEHTDWESIRAAWKAGDINVG